MTPRNMPAVIETFYCYVDTDRRLLRELDKHLRPLQFINAIATWSALEIQAGMDLELELQSHVRYTDLFLLLISPDFLATNLCNTGQMAKALEKYKAGEADIIPILLHDREKLTGVKQPAQRLGHHQSLLWRYFPQECALIARRNEECEQQRRKERESQACEEVRQAVLTLHAQNIFPSQRCFIQCGGSSMRRSPVHSSRSDTKQCQNSQGQGLGTRTPCVLNTRTGRFGCDAGSLSAS